MQSSAALSRHDRLIWAAVLPLLLYLTLTGAGATPGIFVTPFRLVSLVILGLVFSAWTILAWTHPGARPRTTLMLPIGLALLAMGISTVASADIRAGAEFLAYAVALTGLYLLLVIVMGRPALARRIVVVLAGATLTLAVAYIIFVVASWTEWWNLVGHLAVPPTRPAYAALSYEAPGILSAFLVTAAAASIAFLLPGGRGDRALSLALVVAVGAAVVLASSRGSWLGAMVAVVVTAATAMVTGGRLAVPGSARARVTIAGLAVIGAVGLLAIGPAIVSRVLSGGGNERLTFAAAAIRIFEQHPILGSGPGTWGPLRASHTLAGEIDLYIPHAHNVLLQTLAETGALGVVAGAVLGLSVLRLAVSAIRSGDFERRAVGLGAVFVGTYLLAHQMVDFFMDEPAVLFAAVLPVAALDADALRHVAAARVTSQRASWRSALPGSAVGIAGALIALALLVRVELPAMIAWHASDLLTEGQYEHALEHIDDALSRDPGQSTYLWIQALAAAGIGDTAMARADFRAVGEHDDLPQAWLNLAALDLNAGDPAAARQELERALRLGIQQPAITVPAVQLWLRLGNQEEAVRAALFALWIAPALTDDPWWNTSPALTRVRDKARSELLSNEQAASAAWQVAMYAGDFSTSRAIAIRLPPQQGRLARLVIDAWAGVDAALPALEAQARDQPQSDASKWVARVAEHNGDGATAAAFRHWAELGSDAAGVDSGYDTVVTNRLGVFHPVPGPDANFHFWHVYRRAVPGDMLLDTLPKLTMR